MLYKVTKDSKLPSLVLTRRMLLAGSPKQHKPVIQPEGLVKAPSCAQTELSASILLHIVPSNCLKYCTKQTNRMPHKKLPQNKTFR